VQETVFLVALLVIVQEVQTPDRAMLAVLFVVVDAARAILLEIQFALSTV
jgi:hypothetical protein